MKTLIRPFVLAVFLAPGAALAAASSPATPSDPVLERVSAATARKDWPGAQAILREAVQKNPGNADYHNLYAHAIRRGPNPDMNLVFQHYNEALRIDPNHRGAHEYLGEAYLMVNNLPKAKEQLSALDKLCFFTCEEYSDLKKAIGEYEQQHAAR